MKVMELKSSGRIGFVIEMNDLVYNIEFDTSTGRMKFKTDDEESRKRTYHQELRGGNHSLLAHITGGHGIIEPSFYGRIKKVYTLRNNGREADVVYLLSSNEQVEIHWQWNGNKLTYELLFDKGVVNKIEESLRTKINILKEMMDM